jgi:hypothetical protein
VTSSDVKWLSMKLGYFQAVFPPFRVTADSARLTAAANTKKQAEQKVDLFSLPHCSAAQHV